MTSALSSILLSLRRENGLSQMKAARLLGVSQSTLSCYETGKRECSASFLKRTAEFYKVSCDMLLSVSVNLSDEEAQSQRPDDAYSEYENVIHSFVQRVGENDFDNVIKDWFSLFYYKLFRSIYEKNEDNPKFFFSVGDTYERDFLIKLLETAKALSDFGNEKRRSAPKISLNSLIDEYPDDYKSVIALISHAEDLMLGD